MYRIAGIGSKKIPIQNENSKFRVILQMQTDFRMRQQMEAPLAERIRPQKLETT
jgi:hypothetical protein